jgi:hypothetical protein
MNIVRSANDWAAFKKLDPLGYAKERGEDAPAPEQPKVSDVERLLAFVEGMKDSAVVRRNIELCNKAKAEADAQVAASRATLAEHEKLRASHKAQMDAAQADFEKRCAEREAEIRQREEQTRTLNSKAGTDAAAAAQARSRYEAALARLREAASF